MSDTDDNEEDAPVARGTDYAGIEANVGEPQIPKVSGVDPDLAEKDPSEITAEDLQGLSDDELSAVMDLMNQRDESKQDDSSDAGDSDTQTEEPAETEASDASGDESDDEFERPDPESFAETGMLDDDGNFPWEGETLGTTQVGVGGAIEKFSYKGTDFEINEPEDRRRFESNFETLEGVQEMNDAAKRRRVSDRYSQKVAQQCLSVEGHDIDDVYRVEHDGQFYVVADPGGEKGVAHADGAQKLWDSMTWFDRFKLGMRIGQTVLGDGQFRQRFS